MGGSSVRDRAAEEEFRVSRHSLPLSGQLREPPGALIGVSGIEAPDTDRVVLHFDIDAFYAQAEEVREPSLRDRPLGVTQKYLVVTCNYPARRSGVTKLMGIRDARRVCPDIVLVSGEDLTPYREASKRIHAVLERFGTLERLGMDECFVDVTEEALRRASAALRNGNNANANANAALQGWDGHLHVPGGAALQQDNPYRPQDLRVACPNREHDAPPGEEEAALAAEWSGQAWWPALLMGSRIASEARAMVKLETGFRSSCGIACNKMLAKLISGLHKPDDQTALLPPHAGAFMAALPLKAIPGVGYRMSSVLEQRLGAQHVWQVLALDPALVARELGGAKAKWLLAAARGADAQEVAAKGPPKSITVEDSFKSCDSLGAAVRVLQVLAPDLIARLEEDAAEFQRRAGTLTVRWRMREYARAPGKQQPTRTFRSASASCPMPVLVHSARASLEHKAALIVGAATSLLRRSLPASGFSLAAINVGAANLQKCTGRDAEGRGSSAVSLEQILVLRAERQASGREAQQLADGAGQGDPILLTGGEPKPPAEADAACPRTARNAADASAVSRRSYSGASAPGAGPLMSKRQERELRELRGSPPGNLPLARSPGLPAMLSCGQERQQALAAVAQTGRECETSQPSPAGASPASRPGGGGCGSAPSSHAGGAPGPSQEERDRSLALKLQQEELDAFRRAASAPSRNTAPQRSKGKKRPAGRDIGKGGPLDAFVTRRRRDSM